MSGLKLIEPTVLYNLLNQETTYSCLTDPVFMLLVDAREKDDYNESHIITAKRAIKNEGTNEFAVPFDADLECKTHVVVYDGSTTSLDDDCTPALECAGKLWELGSRNPVEVLRGGYEAFSALYPFHRTQKIIYMPKELDAIQTYPAEIIPGFLYLGNSQHGCIPYIQKELRVKAHVNCCEEHDKFFAARSPALLHIPASDTEEPAYDLYEHFQAAYDFIVSFKSQQQVVLVYSQLGISRSASIVLAYLMMENKCSLQEALNHVKSCRPQVCPNSGFMSQLQLWEFVLNKDTAEGITDSIHNIEPETAESYDDLPAEESVDNEEDCEEC